MINAGRFESGHAMKQKKRIAGLRPRHILLCCVVLLLFLGAAVVSQTGKMKEIQAEKDTLATEHDALLLEEERLSRMLEYAQTDEYKQQYAREVLGYIGPNDYKFYRDEPTE